MLELLVNNVDKHFNQTIKMYYKMWVSKFVKVHIVNNCTCDSIVYMMVMAK